MISNNPYATGKHIWDDNVDGLLGDLRQGDSDMHVNEVAREERARQIGLAYIREHPGRTLLLWPKKLEYMYRSDIEGLFYTMGMIEAPGRALKIIYLGLRAFAETYYVAILALAFFSWRVVLRGKSTGYKMGLYVALYFTAVCLVFHGNARYHFPIMPWIAMYAGIGGSLLLKQFDEIDSQSLDRRPFAET